MQLKDSKSPIPKKPELRKKPKPKNTNKNPAVMHAQIIMVGNEELWIESILKTNSTSQFIGHTKYPDISTFFKSGENNVSST